MFLPQHKCVMGLSHLVLSNRSCGGHKGDWAGYWSAGYGAIIICEYLPIISWFFENAI